MHLENIEIDGVAGIMGEGTGQPGNEVKGGLLDTDHDYFAK